MLAVFGDISFALRPFGPHVMAVVERRAFSEIFAGHGLHRGLNAVHEDVGFLWHVGLLQKSPAELLRRRDHLLNGLLALAGPVEGDMGDGKLTDLGLAAGFMIDIQAQPQQSFKKTHKNKPLCFAHLRSFSVIA